MSASRPVFIVSNDIVPGLGMPVAAPGLRAFGLSEGLKARGFDVTTLVVKGFVERQWGRLGRPVPYPTAPGTEIVGAGRLLRHIKTNAPADVVLINSNQVDRLRPVPGVRYVLDFFAPKMLEELYHHGEGYPAEELKELRERKIRAIKLADAFVVNGAKKVPYFLAWLLQSGRDVRELPLEVVNMAVPLAFSGEPEPRADGGVRFAATGYLQSWSTLGAWVRTMERHLGGADGATLDLVLPRHWGGATGLEYGSEADLRRLAGHPSVTAHGPMGFGRFREFLSGIDVAIDLFEHNLEREYAMVTRSVVALACGVPVIHPPFTEVSPMISSHDAGWLVDPDDEAAFDAIVRDIVSDPALVYRKKKNARTLARDLLDPAVAVEPLARILEGR